MSSRSGICVLLVLAGSSFSSKLQAGQIQAIYAFGDSLSDVGNIFTATGHTVPGPPYFNGQFSNGNIWLQDLAADLGLAPLTPSLVPGGTDYAYGDAQSGTTVFNTASSIDLSGPTGQVAQFLAANPAANPNALYTIWIGSNDLTPILEAPPGTVTTAEIATDLVDIAGNVDTAINALAAAGAKNFLVVTVPDLGLAPGGNAAASALSLAFDNTLVNGSAPIPSLSALAAGDSVDISVLNTYALIDSIVGNPSQYGLTNVTDPCLTGAIDFVGGTACATPNQYLFWDPSGHPTAAADVFVADAALSLVAPEPASISLMAAGLFGLILVSRRYSLSR